MKRTISIKLDVSQEHDCILLELQKQFSGACNQAAKIAVEEAKKNRVQLHHAS